MNKYILGLLSFSFLTGCASQGINRADQNEVVQEFYASVESVKKVELSSEVKTGIVGGAVVGTIDELDGNSEDMISGAIAGALVGGIFTAIFEGSNDAYEYQLKSKKKGDFALIQKEQLADNVGCVKVRVASKVLLSSTDTVNCDNLLL